MLITTLDPVLYIQETFSKKDNINIKNYQEYSHINSTGLSDSGVGTIFKKIWYLHHRKIELKNRTIDSCCEKYFWQNSHHMQSVYPPPCAQIKQDELEDLIKHLPKPFILQGDFNSHNTICESKVTNDEVKIIETFLMSYICSTRVHWHIEIGFSNTWKWNALSKADVSISNIAGKIIKSPKRENERAVFELEDKEKFH